MGRSWNRCARKTTRTMGNYSVFPNIRCRRRQRRTSDRFSCIFERLDLKREWRCPMWASWGWYRKHDHEPTYHNYVTGMTLLGLAALPQLGFAQSDPYVGTASVIASAPAQTRAENHPATV